MDKTPQERRPDLIRAMLPHVAFDGWGDTALMHAANDLGLDVEEAHLSFPGGVSDMIDTYTTSEIEEMERVLSTRGLHNMKIRERIFTAVQTRLELASGNKEASLRAARILALPQNNALALKILWRTVDAIWRAVGDKSTDFNYYSKRATLSAVYSATYLYWLDDTSEGHQNTWAFLHRRIEDVMKIEKAKQEWRKTRAQMPSLTRFLGRLRYPVS